MSKMNEIASGLLGAGEAQCIIGYTAGTGENVRPAFAVNAQEVASLLFDGRCTQNLAMYLYKREVKALGKPAIVTNTGTLRGIVRLAAEKQVAEDAVIAIAMQENGEAVCLRTLEEIENHLAASTHELNERDRALLDKLAAMTEDERWAFWKTEMESCIKCYACRQACPLCYCTQCTVENNQPQWITVAASTLGNLEWHAMRAMHLAGRCISCGQCGQACPVGIPIHLLPMRLSEEIREVYGMTTGTRRDEGCAMATFLPNDKESFIG